ncbi:hypothetical protein P154DRAFT_438640 [Amniculicola lignicola CBS 123094]|uniref:Rhodopsin domain-containing protein n=1 Tax=Amniculicola lignicola CBS 123094 TaxID=1392246 RepID=A0A6A5WHR6_9PLEO|nr:hypothetical protein P154DRAFT_438640 [Amniculicola lignicola CBS 123094]
MAGAKVGSPEYLAETNDAGLDQRVSVWLLLSYSTVDTFFYCFFIVGIPMLVCSTLAYILCIESAVTGILMVKFGDVGCYVIPAPVAAFQIWLQLSKVLEFTYTPSSSTTKPSSSPNYRGIIVAIGAIVTLQGIIALILPFSICRPFRYFWTQVVGINDGSCGDVMLLYKSYCIPSLITDVAMLVLPFPIFLKPKIPTAENIGLILTFLAAALGIRTCALLFAVFFATPLFSDPTWYASGGPMIYTLLESSIYMIASILPTSRYLYRRIHRNLRQGFQLRSAKGDGSAKNLQSPTHSAKLGRIERGKGGACVIRLHVDIWQTNTTSSQEELTLRG